MSNVGAAYVVLLGVLLLAGCADPVPVRVVYTATGIPASGVLVQRRRPASRWEKISNPIGTFYHPQVMAEAHWTDAEGRCTLKAMGVDDAYDLVTTAGVSLTAAVGTNRILLDPGTNANLAAWHYFARREDGHWTITVAEPWWNWTKDKPELFGDAAGKLASPKP